MGQTIFVIVFIVVIFIACIAGPSVKDKKQEKQKQQNPEEISKMYYMHVKKLLSHYFLIHGFIPSDKDLHYFTNRMILAKSAGHTDEDLAIIMISFIPMTQPTLEEFNKYLFINTDILIKKFIPQKWQSEISIEAYGYCNATENDMQYIINFQKDGFRPEEMKLYRFNYEQCAYAILYKTLLTIVPMNDDFTEEVRSNIIKKVIVGAEEEGYNLKDE